MYYTSKEIQKVYKQFHNNYYSVLYSADNGLTFQYCPFDTGKWHINEWIFLFIEKTVK